MKRNIFIVLTLALVCVLFAACGKEEVTPIDAAINELQSARENIDNQIAALEAQRPATKGGSGAVLTNAEVPVDVVEEVVFTLPNPDDFDDLYELMGWTRRDLSQNPSYLATRLFEIGIIEEQDVEGMTNYLGTHPEDLTKLIEAYTQYVELSRPARERGIPESELCRAGCTIPLVTCTESFDFGADT